MAAYPQFAPDRGGIEEEVAETLCFPSVEIVDRPQTKGTVSTTDAKHKVTTDSNHKFSIASNLLDRNVTADQPNPKWAGDISYIWTREGWLHLAVISRQHGFNVSMSGKGNCYDNAAVETFFKTIKAELIWQYPWVTRRKTEMAIFEYINGFYNPRRRHSAPGSVAFERKAA